MSARDGQDRVRVLLSKTVVSDTLSDPFNLEKWVGFSIQLVLTNAVGFSGTFILQATNYDPAQFSDRWCDFPGTEEVFTSVTSVPPVGRIWNVDWSRYKWVRVRLHTVSGGTSVEIIANGVPT